MIETVFALLMIINHEIKEHRIQDSLSTCLKHKRIAERSVSNNVLTIIIKIEISKVLNPFAIA